MVVRRNKLLLIVDYSHDPDLRTDFYQIKKHKIHKCKDKDDNI